MSITALGNSAGELFAVLGPNGGGKRRCFACLRRFIPLQTGCLTVWATILARRRKQTPFAALIGVVSGTPASKQLTIAETIRLQAADSMARWPGVAKRLEELLIISRSAIGRTNDGEANRVALGRRVEWRRNGYSAAIAALG